MALVDARGAVAQTPIPSAVAASRIGSESPLFTALETAPEDRAFGEFFRETLKLNDSLNFHVIEDDGSGWQMEHVYRRNFLDGLVYVGGFADHNVNGTADSSDWVSETQVGVKLLGNFYAVAEYRYFSFANASRFKQGVGIGVEYAIRFP